jgi:hypothetical protein
MHAEWMNVRQFLGYWSLKYEQAPVTLGELLDLAETTNAVDFVGCAEKGKVMTLGRAFVRWEQSVLPSLGYEIVQMRSRTNGRKYTIRVRPTATNFRAWLRHWPDKTTPMGWLAREAVFNEAWTTNDSKALREALSSSPNSRDLISILNHAEDGWRIYCDTTGQEVT